MRDVVKPIAIAGWLVAVLAGCGQAPTDATADPAAACDQGLPRLEVIQSHMAPTLEARDVSAVIPLGLLGPRRGDIVAIAWSGWTGDIRPSDTPMRVIALPGDRVELRDGQVVLNGAVLHEPYVPNGAATDAIPGQPAAWVVPAGDVFVLGDSRQNVADSRAYGFVPDAALTGRVIFRCGPPDRRGSIG